MQTHTMATRAALDEWAAQATDLAERIIEDARADSRATDGAQWQVYEQHKRRIGYLNLEANQYERAMKNLATALNI